MTEVKTGSPEGSVTTRSGVAPEAVAELAGRLTEHQRKLLLGEAQGWGFWMFEVGGELVRLEMANKVGGSIEWNELGLDVIDYLKPGNGRTFAFDDEHWPGLAKLIEEMGEAVTEVGKLMMTHGYSNHWSGNLHERLLDEIADVEAAIVFFNRHNLDADERRAMARRVTMKVGKFEQWHTEQRDEPAERHVA